MLKNLKGRLLLGLTLLSAAFMHAQTGTVLPRTGGIDSVVQAFMHNWDITGGSMALTKNGKLIYNRGFGYADAGKTRAVTPGDQFRIASVSKPITAIAIMKLVEDGKLDLNDRVFGRGAILSDPYYVDAIRDRRIYGITVRDLLEHTAGWDRKHPYGEFGHSDAPFFPLHVTDVEHAPNPVGDSTLIRFSLKQGLQSAPGTSYAYSNIGYLVLGKIIEKASGMKYGTYVQEVLLSPLGIGSTQLGRNLRTDRAAREVEYIGEGLTASCYGNGTLVPDQYGGFNLEAMNAHGGWISSASDLSRLLLAVDGLGSVPDLLAPETIREMTEPGRENANYAKGWSVNERGNWWHTGSLAGTSSFVGRTADGYTWVILFNGRADNSTAFWKALDRLPWKAIQSLPAVPEGDLFDSPAM